MNITEIMEALLSGKKIAVCYWGVGSFIWIQKGKLVDDKGAPYGGISLEQGEWEIYKEPHIPVKYSVDVFIAGTPALNLGRYSLCSTLFGDIDGWSTTPTRDWKKYKITLEEVVE
jgi:hypothetical protein